VHQSPDLQGSCFGGGYEAETKAPSKPVGGWQTAEAAEAYRGILYAESGEMRDAQNDKMVRSGVSVEAARAVLAEPGKLSAAELVRLPVIRIPRRPTDPNVPLDLQKMLDLVYVSGR
jgi:hypothetical protein